MEMGELYQELDLTGLSGQVEQLFPEFSVDFASLLKMVLKGNLGEAAGSLFSSLRGVLGAEAAGMKNLLVTLLLIGLLSALFTVLAASFKNHQTADIAHFLSYLLVLSVVLGVFTKASGLAAQLLERMLTFVRLVVPTFMLALGFSAGTVTAAGYYQLILLLIYGVEQLLAGIGLPLVNIYMLLVVMNGIWEEERLTAMLDTLYRGLVASMKFLLSCITGIGLLQSMVAPVIEHLKQGTVSRVISAIPGLGGLAEGTAQLLLGSAVLVKNGLGVVAVLLLVAVCAVPLLKLCLLAGVLKLCAGLLGMTADKRLTACVSASGDVCLLLLRVSYTAAACFLILFAIMICLCGKA